MFPPQSRSRSFLEKHKSVGRLAGIKARTKPSLTQAMRVLREIENASGFHPERNLQIRPTIGVDAEKDYYDPVSKNRWNPQLREQQNGKGNPNAPKPKGNKGDDARDARNGKNPPPPQGQPNNGRGNGPPEPPEAAPGAAGQPPEEEEPEVPEEPGDGGSPITRQELPDDPQKDSRKKVKAAQGQPNRPDSSTRIAMRYSMEGDPFSTGIRKEMPTNAAQIRQMLKNARGNRKSMPNNRKKQTNHAPVQKYWS